MVMTFRNLQIFSKVAELGSMSKAAEALYISQPSVSLAISDIEREYNVLLFDRVSRSLYLTYSGEKLLEYANSILYMREEMEEFLNNESANPCIRIGATATVGACIMSPIISDLLQSIPNLKHEVLVANTLIIEDLLLKSKLDIGLVEGTVRNPNLETKEVIRDRLVFTCSTDHRFMGRKSIRLEELDNEPLILREPGSGTRAQLEDLLKIKGFQCNIRWSCYNIEAIKDAIMHNLGVSVMSERLVRDSLQRRELWVCDIEGSDEFNRTFKLAYHRNKVFTDSMNQFVQACSDFEQTKNFQNL